MRRVLANGELDDSYTAYWRVGDGDVIPCPRCGTALQLEFGVEPDTYRCGNGSTWVDTPYEGCIQPNIEILGDTQ